jgi:predicted deacetylase
MKLGCAIAPRDWPTCGARTEFIDRLNGHPGETVLLVVPPGESLSMFEKFFNIGKAQEVGGTAGTLFALRGAGY